MEKDIELLQELLAEVKACRADVKRVKTVMFYLFLALTAVMYLIDFENKLFLDSELAYK